MDMLLTMDADVDVQGFEGNTALLCPAAKDDVVIVDELLQHNANPNIRNTLGHSFFYYLRRKQGRSNLWNSSISLSLNYFVRKSFLQFLSGCGFAQVLESDYYISTCRNSVVRCLEDHYWVRSMLEYIHVADPRSNH